MASNFVLACGGTGGRCAEALGYLFASRAIVDPCHVLIIDPDQGNGNIDDARKQLQDYALVRETILLPQTPTGDIPFFSALLNEGGGGFFWANPNAEKTWSDSLNYHTQTPQVRGLLDLLYDQSDLDLTFEKGYVGRAHIGSLDLLRTIEPHLKRAKDSPNKTDAIHQFIGALRDAALNSPFINLIVIGSVFGGTGASALPAIPALITEAIGKQLRNRLRIACVEVTPYFTFPEGSANNPDAAVHPVATQAALRYYASTPVGYDRLYLVGGHDRPATAHSNEIGGGTQRNAPHHVELVAALGVAHFFAHPPQQRPERTQLFTSAARAELAWSKLPGGDSLNLRQNLISFTTFCLMHTMFLSREIASGDHRGRTWMSVLQQGTRQLSGSEPALAALDRFTKRFLTWARFVQSFSGSALFTLEAESAMSARTIGAVSVGGLASDVVFDQLMRFLESRLDDNKQPTGIGFYIHALTRAADAFCAAHYTNWNVRAPMSLPTPRSAAAV